MAKKARSHPVREVSYRLEDIENAAQHIRDAMEKAVSGSTDADETINGYFGDEFSIDLRAVLPEAGVKIIKKFLSSNQIASVKITTPVGSQVMGVAMAAHYLKHVVIPCAKKFEGNTPPSASDLEAMVGLFKKHGFSINQLLGPEQQQTLTGHRQRWEFKKALARHYGFKLRLLPTPKSSHDLSKHTGVNKTGQSVFEDILHQAWHPLIQKMLVASLQEADPPLTLLPVIQGMKDPNELRAFLKSLKKMDPKDRERIIARFKQDIKTHPPSLSIAQLGIIKSSRMNHKFDLMDDDLYDTLIDHFMVGDNTKVMDREELPEETKEALLQFDTLYEMANDGIDLYEDFERRSQHWAIHQGEVIKAIIDACEQTHETDIDAIRKLLPRINEHIGKINPPRDEAQREQIATLRKWQSTCVRTLHQHGKTQTTHIPAGIDLPRNGQDDGPEPE